MKQADQLKLAQWFNTIDATEKLAKNDFEKAAAQFWATCPQDLIPSLSGNKAGVLFRLHHVPIFALLLTAYYSGKTNSAMWLYQAGYYLNAYERIHLEMVLEKSRKGETVSHFGDTWEGPDRANHLDKLPRPKLAWFQNCKGSWEPRFVEWRTSCRKSFEHWVNSWCNDVTGLPRTQAEAAFLGAVFSSDQPPIDFLDDLIHLLKKSGQSTTKAFFRNLTDPKPLHQTDIEIECWLIEIWPLVLKHQWNYANISRLAIKRFSGKEDKVDLSSISTRCRKLQLKLGASAKKGGRPQSQLHETFSFPELHAIWIKGAGSLEKSWICGQRNLAVNPD